MIYHKLALGIDTSNYKTSVAVVDSRGNVLFNSRKFLNVKKGERGLRQSEALFQHVKQLPDAIEKALSDPEIRHAVGCVSVSVKPRPVEGSYMPVFLAGEAFAQTLSAALGVPMYRFSHQEGHIEAVSRFVNIDKSRPFICFHFSGGTTEAILTDKNEHTFEIVGGSKDLAYGQVLDRIGVSMGFDFPCGEELDKTDCLFQKNGASHRIFSKIKVRDGFLNLSGTETQGQRLVGSCSKELIISDLFRVLSQSVCDMTEQLASKYNIDQFIYAGGVSSSGFIRDFLEHRLGTRYSIFFGSPELSSDNAVGTALLGGNMIWL